MPAPSTADTIGAVADIVDRQHVTTLVYAVRSDRLLMLQRKKAPNLGLWSPPGGKLEPGEAPTRGALRELVEETGLHGHSPRLLAVVSEIDPTRREAWLMFVVRVDVDVDGPLLASDEGVPVWVSVTDVESLPTPPADRHITAAVLADAPGVTCIEVRFRDGHLDNVTVHPA